MHDSHGDPRPHSGDGPGRLGLPQLDEALAAFGARTRALIGAHQNQHDMPGTGVDDAPKAQFT